jgi:hypothetical protein
MFIVDHLADLKKSGQIKMLPSPAPRHKREGNWSRAGSGYMEFFKEMSGRLREQLLVCAGCSLVLG